MSHEVHEEVVLAAKERAVWQALVDHRRRRQWWSYLELDPVVDGGFVERWVGPDGEEVLTKGSVLELVPGRRLRLSWADENWPAETEVEIRLCPSDGGTTVVVRHRGWDRLPDGERLAEEHRAGWRRHLANLRAHVER